MAMKKKRKKRKRPPPHPSKSTLWRASREADRRLWPLLKSPRQD
jgi:hypothetical protein